VKVERAQKPRVLLVPDVPYWICGTIARAYVRHNPQLDMRICSGRVLRRIPEVTAYAGHFDVVHFLTPHDANKSQADFRGRVATVSTIHHVQDGSNLDSVAGADSVMTGSTQWQGRLEEAGVPAEKLVVVPYGVDTSIFYSRSPEERKRLRQENQIEAHAFVVGFVGKRSSDAHGRKGTDVFLRGIERLAQQEFPVHVVLIGPGWEAVARELADQGVGCTRKPFVTDEREFAATYALMDAYWCTSTIEGGPVPVLEAMASGVCVLATQVGMVPDVMNSDAVGRMLPFNDAEAFARETAALQENPTRQQAMGAAAAQRIREYFDWSHTATGVRPLYETAQRNFCAAHPEAAELPTECPPWPAEWIAREEARLTKRFLQDAHHPPSAFMRQLRKVTESRWATAWLRSGARRGIAP